MKKAVFHSIMALVLVLGLTLAMALPVLAQVGFPITEKVVVWEDTDGHPEGVYLEHQNVLYLLRVANNSSAALEVEWIRDVFAYGTAAEEDRVWDNTLGEWVDYDPDNPPTAFSIPSPGEWSRDVTHQIPLKEVVGDTVENRIMVRGEAGELYTRNIPQTVNVIRPAIELTKIVTPGMAGVGQIVTYEFTITNTGDWPLEIISLIDDELGDLPVAGLVLDPGHAAGVTHPYTIQDGDLPLTNTATVTAVAQGFDQELFGSGASPTAMVEDTASAMVTALHPVGGTASPVSRLMLIAPWIVLAGLVVGAAVFVWSRRAQTRA